MTTQREHWGSKLGFILAAAGSAIGLGTMWKLPYVMGQNGGGAFILTFLFFIVLVGIPLFIAELALGRQSQRAAVGCFQAFTAENSSWSMVGWMGVFANILVAGWYAVIAGWGFNYMLMTLANAFQDRTVEEVGQAFDVFRASGDLNVLWQVIFLSGTAGIVLKGVSKGIEYWSRILTSALFVVLVGLAIYSSTLEGFGQAAQYVLYPDFSALTPTGVLKALGLALFSLSVGQGIMVTYGSYMSAGDDIPKTSFIVSGSIILVSVLISLMIFPMVFTLGFAPQSGEGLIFKTLPYVFEQLPGSLIIGVMFFALLAFAAITSSVSQLEVIVANLIDLYGWTRQKAVMFSTFFCLLVGLPTALEGSKMAIFPTWKLVFKTTFLETNYILIDWLLTIFALCIAIFVGWKLPEKVRDAGFLSGSSMRWFYKPWLFLVRWIVPACIIIVMLSQAHLIDFNQLLAYAH